LFDCLYPEWGDIDGVFGRIDQQYANEDEAVLQGYLRVRPVVMTALLRHWVIALPSPPVSVRARAHCSGLLAGCHSTILTLFAAAYHFQVGTQFHSQAHQGSTTRN
jgi:hypothetical protein